VEGEKAQVEGEKVQVTKFGLEDFIFVVSSAANSVGTTLEFAAFCSGPDAKNSRISASSFFLSVHNHGFCGGPNTFFPGKTQVWSCRSASCHGKRNKW